jgi:hypothetical protein
MSSEKAAGFDGEIFTGMAVDVRHIEIVGFLDAVLNRRAMEAEIKKVFNVGCEGVLEYYHRKDRKRYTINCFTDKMPDVSFTNARVEFVINLKCLDHFWYGDEITLNIPRYSLTFNNAGDSIAGAVYELAGSASEPFITNVSGKRITYKSGLAGQTLKITSMPNKSMVELAGSNAMRHLTDPARRGFFLLDIGSNTVSYGAASGADGLSVRMFYRPRYLGAF